MSGRTRWLDALEDRIGRMAKEPFAAEESVGAITITIVHQEAGTVEQVQECEAARRDAILQTWRTRRDPVLGLRVIVRYQRWPNPQIVEVDPAAAVRASLRKADDYPRLRLVKPESRAKVFDDAGLPANAEKIREQEARDRGEPIGGFDFQL